MSKHNSVSSPDPRPSSTTIGTNAEKIDSRDKVTGVATYGSDLERPNLLHASVLRSNIPHGRLIAVDTASAEALDGVVQVISREEVLGQYDNRVRHYGDMIAAVAAEDQQTATEAIRHIEYEIERLESVHDPRTSVTEGGPTLHENVPDQKQHNHHAINLENDKYVQNIDDYHALTVGDVTEGFAKADIVSEGTYISPRVNHCNLDSHCVIAEWEEGTLVLTETLGSPGRSQEEISKFLGIDQDDVRIISPPTASSSFGGRSVKKLTLEPVAATLSHLTDRPVKLWFDREEEFVATETRHRTYYTIKTGVTMAGDLTALKMDVVTDTGGYPNGVGHIVLSNSQDRPLDLYKIPNYRYEGVSVFTNNVPAGEYRGIGSTQMTFALESHMDEVAREAGFDPAAFRLRNFVEQGHVRPHTKVPIESCGIRECLERGSDTFETIQRGEQNDPTKRRGTGFAAGTHTTASGTSGKDDSEGTSNTDSSEARLTLHPDGRVTASTAAVDHGQGANTVMAQIITETTGIPIERISVERFETTDSLEDLLGSVASRSTYIIGATVLDAAEKLRDRLRKLAAGRIDGVTDAVELVDGYAVAGDESIPITTLVPTDGLTTFGYAESASNPPSFGVHFAEVEVDIETGDVDILTFVAAQDVGFAINPKMVEGQLEGAIQHGIEFALYSDVKLEQGTPVNANLADYAAISPWEMPQQLACEIIESNEETGPFGAKGIGTPTMPPIAPAIMNALRDATGTRFTQAPVDSETIHRVINDY